MPEPYTYTICEFQYSCSKGKVFYYLCTFIFLHFNRKLKKLVRTLKEKETTPKAREEEKPPQQWNLDYALAPFEGLTPEYMEMSE